ncbi:MAG TPA: coiled-coil domain-containing protein [Stellaceae bacterium]|nr:coiled-coil domain-containing protein [Stellaceae bacterium]
MAALAIDTLKVAKRLREAGFSDPQAEAVVATVQEAAEGADLATRSDLAELRSEIKFDLAELRAELKAELAELRVELRAEIAAVRAEMRALELRFEAKLEALKADILNRIFGLILGAVVVNVVAVVAAMFGVAKLLGH